MPLHWYQTRAIGAVQSSWTLGSRRVLLVSPTGSGKTVMGAEIARREVLQGGRVLIVVHREEILRQTLAKLQAASAPAGPLGSDAPVVVAMIQTLASRGPRCLPVAPTLTIWDEAHHLCSPQWQLAYAWFRCRSLCLTATPWGIPPNLVDDVIVGALPSELRASGHMPPMQILSFAEPDTSNIRIRGGEYAINQLAEATNVKALRGNVLQSYLDHAPDLPAFGFAVNVAHSKALAEDFRNAGIPSEHVDGQSKDRVDILRRFISGQIRVLWNCDLLGEGTDVPGARLAILARPLWSLRAYLQQSGRIRAHGAIARIHDHGGNLERHGHPQADRDYNLTADVRPRKRTTKAAVQSVPRKTAVVELDAVAHLFTPDTCGLPYDDEEVTEKLTGMAA